MKKKRDDIAIGVKEAARAVFRAGAEMMVCEHDRTTDDGRICFHCGSHFGDSGWTIAPLVAKLILAVRPLAVVTGVFVTEEEYKLERVS